MDGAMDREVSFKVMISRDEAHMRADLVALLRRAWGDVNKSQLDRVLWRLAWRLRARIAQEDVPTHRRAPAPGDTEALDAHEHELESFLQDVLLQVRR